MHKYFSLSRSFWRDRERERDFSMWGELAYFKYRALFFFKGEIFFNGS
jgi:hypothetical protein